MQIREIVLYGTNGRLKQIPLNLGKVNIITGDPTTGKSALIEIIDYCLGSEKCTIPEGKVREHVSWYGLLLQIQEERIFVARKNPPLDQQTTNDAYFEQGAALETPKSAPNAPNTTIDDLVSFLSKKIGIAPNKHTPKEGQTHEGFEVTIRHGLFFCLQKQDEIALSTSLFHRQGEPYRILGIRFSLPYLLGAAKEEELALKNNLLNARKELNQAKNALEEANMVKGTGLSQAFKILNELQEAGIIESNKSPQTLDEFVAVFRNYVGWTPSRPIVPDSDRLHELQAEISQYQSELAEKKKMLRAAEIFDKERKGYSNYLERHASRLQAVGLFEENNIDDRCPLCDQSLSRPIPKATSIKESLADIRRTLEITQREEPQLVNYISDLKMQITRLRHSINLRRDTIRSIIEHNETLKKDQSLLINQLRIIGRMSLWLDNVNLTDPSSKLAKEVEKWESEVAKLEALVDQSHVDDNVNMAMIRLGSKMTELSKKVDWEYNEYPILLDPSRLLLVIEKGGRQVPMKEVGSGHNWLACHLIAHAALHDYFVRENRPTPRFLFLDQPSQAYFVNKRKGESFTSKDEESLLMMYNFVFDFAESLGSEFQIIMTEHAELDDPRFNSFIVQKWRNGRKLIPTDWYE